MALKRGDPIPPVCTPVGNVIFTKLDNVGGNLDVEVGSSLSGTIPLAAKKSEYVASFLQNEIVVCEENRTFAGQNTPLMVDIQVRQDEVGCFVIATQPNSNSILAFSSKNSAAPKLTRTSDGYLWAVGVLDDGVVDYIHLFKSIDGGLTWSDEGEVNSNPGDAAGATICSDSNDVLHIAWTQNIYNVTSAQNIFYKSIGGSGSSSQITFDSGNSSNYHASVAINNNDEAYIAWTADGTIKYCKVVAGTPTGYVTVGVGYLPCILVDRQDKVHLTYSGDGIDISYYHQDTGLEVVAPRGYSGNMSLIPTIYSDSSLHYNPYLFYVDKASSYSSYLVQALKTETGWQYKSPESTYGSVDTAEQSDLGEDIVLTIPNHNLLDGEKVRVYWDGRLFPPWYNTFEVSVVDADKIQLVSSGIFNLSSSWPASKELTDGVWTFDPEIVGVSRDAEGTIYAFYQSGDAPAFGGSDVFFMFGTPLNLSDRALFEEDAAWPSPTQLDQEGTGNYAIGYMFTSGDDRDPEFFKHCSSLEEP